MDRKEIFKQMVNFNKTAFDNTFAALTLLQEQKQQMTKVFMEHESNVGTTFTGRVVGRTLVGEREAIVPSIEGSAWVTGEHAFHIDGDDPLRAGFRL